MSKQRLRSETTNHAELWNEHDFHLEAQHPEEKLKIKKCAEWMQVTKGHQIKTCGNRLLYHNPEKCCRKKNKKQQQRKHIYFKARSTYWYNFTYDKGTCKGDFTQIDIMSRWSLNEKKFKSLPTANMPLSKSPDISRSMLFSMSLPHILWYSINTTHANTQSSD